MVKAAKEEDIEDNDWKSLYVHLIGHVTHLPVLGFIQACYDLNFVKN